MTLEEVQYFSFDALMYLFLIFVVILEDCNYKKDKDRLDKTKIVIILIISYIGMI